ncbi:MAG: disulfide oxidoreductase [Alphaproteobacteria bacterium]|nr:disulfide oxidoreductase [Alphaproteobacteria bacterium]
MSAPSSRPRITAVLGPTNTGKTHFAIERMLVHGSGMVGFPLRLLARENYDRVVAIKGARKVALITGEERIVPKNPAYLLCTVESMPLDHAVDFLAVDEIQLAADRERGHIFTDRLLNARGLVETMFLGSEIARRLVRRLVPEAEYLSRPRFSDLRHTGPRRLTRLPPRSAAVAFSAAGVYELAEVMRRRHGGVAVVMGALSPRTRNAQVGMYQAGEVDYLVATDAIGMGLNMNINHVAFAALSKFDGFGQRPLSAHELGQIAGRAGRYLANGTFGTTNGVGAIDEEAVAAVEGHAFDPLKGLYWRNADLDFSSLATLRRALDAPPPDTVLLRAPEADDQRLLVMLAGRDEVAERATGASAVRLMWEVCQVPDFRKILSDSHARFLERVFLHLTGDGRLPTDWVARQIAAIDRTDGEIETLTQRISFIRTWTYISHRSAWLDDGPHWQERTRAIEDRLSDALHQRLTQRFVDRRAAALARGLAGGRKPLAAVTRDDDVLVEGQFVGRLAGFQFVADDSATGEDARAIRVAALLALRGVVPARLRACCESADRAFKFDEVGRIHWLDAPIAELVPGRDVLAPQVRIMATDLLEPADRELLRRRVAVWINQRVEQELGALLRLHAGAAAMDGPCRALAFQLGEAFGAAPRRRLKTTLDALDSKARKALRGLGVRFGVESVYLSGLGRGRALRRTLWAVHHGADAGRIPAAVLSLPRRPDVDDDAYRAQGFTCAGPWAVRVDALERMVAEARRLAGQGPCLPTPALAAMIGMDAGQLPDLLNRIGFITDAKDGTFADAASSATKTRQRPARRGKSARAGRAKTNPDSPFAKLKDLKIAP